MPTPPPTTTTTTVPSAPPPQTQQSPPPLPPPQTFDLLPPLHALLSRLLPPLSTTTPNLTNSTTTDPPPLPLTPKELGPAASAITNKIQRARVAVSELPDVEMSLEEQEAVIGELEAEVRRLEGVLGGMGRGAREGGGHG